VYKKQDKDVPRLCIGAGRGKSLSALNEEFVIEPLGTEAVRAQFERRTNRTS